VKLSPLLAASSVLAGTRRRQAATSPDVQPTRLARVRAVASACARVGRRWLQLAAEKNFWYQPLWMMTRRKSRCG